MHFHFVLFLSLLILPNLSFAAGAAQGAKANGMAAAFVAVADDASAIAYNPAGITQLSGSHLYAGVIGIAPRTKYTSPAGVSQNMKSQFFAAPYLYYTSDTPIDNLYFGVGISSPFGIGGTKWSTAGMTRYISTESLTDTLTINPTIAYKLTDSLSIAGGFSYLFSQLKSSNNTDQSMLGAADGAMSLKGDGDGFGYNLGLLYQINSQLKIGIAYRSQTTVNFTGDLNLVNIAPAAQPLFGGSTYTTGFNTSTVFPSVFNLGLAYTAEQGTVFTIEVQRDGWSSLQQNVLTLQQPVAAAGLVSTTTPLDWKDAWSYKIAMDYRLTEKSSFRLGYAYTGASVPDHTLSPSSPIANSHLVGIGYGYQIGDFTIDLFYFDVLMEKRTTNNSILKGSYKSHIHHAGIGVGYQFN
ncbi:MAG: outer membrane protein transport protein [Mariprofundaceae bacterium]